MSEDEVTATSQGFAAGGVALVAFARAVGGIDR
jgi:hypothetical protein